MPHVNNEFKKYSLRKVFCLMNDSSYKEYTIPLGEFARICGTTRDTLRYYEKHQVLMPWKNPENGYHYYSYAQIGSFYFISTLRSADLTIKEIRDYLLLDNQTGFLPYIDVQIDALKQQRRELDRKIRQLSVVTLLDSALYHSGYGVPVIHDFPSDIRFHMAPVSSENAFSLSDIARDIQNHIHLFPDMAGSFPAGTAMDAAAFLKGDYRYIKVISLYHAEDADLYPTGNAGQKPDPGTIEAWESVTAYSLPTSRVAAIICRDSDGDIREMYRRLAAFIMENHLTMLTDVFSVSFVNIMDPLQRRRYLKYIFVCIDEKGV